MSRRPPELSMEINWRSWTCCRPGWQAEVTARSGGRRFGGHRPASSPAAGAPFAEVRALDAERRVVSVTGIDPGLVGQDVEYPLIHVVDERLEVRRRGRLADSAGEQAVAGEQMWDARRVSIHDGHRSRRVPAQRDHVQSQVADGDGVALLEALVDGHWQRVRVGVAGIYRRAGLVGDRCQRLPVIWMADTGGPSKVTSSRIRGASSAASMSSPSPDAVHRSK